MAMETALARASLTNVERRDPYKLFHKMDRAALDALTPAFAWGPFLEAQGVADTAIFNVTEPGFFKAFAGLLGTQPLTAWKTYLKWHVTHARAPYLTKAFYQANFDFFSRTLRGVAEPPPRWKRCVRLVDRDLGEALGRVFVEKTFTPETKAKTTSGATTRRSRSSAATSSATCGVPPCSSRNGRWPRSGSPSIAASGR
jgi:endothelin-converting enzyme/putative endopeptidase